MYGQQDSQSRMHLAIFFLVDNKDPSWRWRSSLRSNAPHRTAVVPQTQLCCASLIHPPPVFRQDILLHNEVCWKHCLPCGFVVAVVVQLGVCGRAATSKLQPSCLLSPGRRQTDQAGFLERRRFGIDTSSHCELCGN